jgi:phosphoribosylamine--glycine ligase
LKVLVIGGGGREHALAWCLARDKSVSQVIISPGNPGCGVVGLCLAPPAPGPEGYLALAQRHGIDLTVVGPEAPLVEGVVDLFEQHGLAAFGPSKAAAQLEGSKIFAKQFMERAGIPTARFAAAYCEREALDALAGFDYPVVLKADGLAAGKGVIIAEDKSQAESTIHGLFSGALVGGAGSKVVIEEFLRGEEISFIALCDGTHALPLEPSQDHKTIFDGDRGPNTGGMGAYSDSRLLTAAQRTAVMDAVIMATVNRMRQEGTPFRGFLYAGLMITAAGPKVLEFNVRCGDPETQALMHRMQGNFAATLLAACKPGGLQGATLACREEPSVCVVMASHGYPGKVRTGDVIKGIASAEATGATVFHAGTKQSGADIVTSGGRVLGVTASGTDLAQAIAAAYAAVDKISFDGMQIRRDIGRKGLSRYN